MTLDAWPQWPVVDEDTLRAVEEAVSAGVWAISWRSRGERLQVSRFREEFAAHVGRSWCVETDHGTSALVVAMEALGVGPGDEVLVPNLTWVSCATAVLQCGATPVLVDVDPETLCIDAAACETLVGPRSRAVLVVHLACTAADMTSLRRLADAHSLFIVEDCAQAHGATWKGGESIGCHGDLAVFSMQAGKALTCGEGGAVVGDDPELLTRIEAARADGRRIVSGTPPTGQMFLSDDSVALMGANYCMSEVSAAILRVGLKRLPGETEKRELNASRLDELCLQAGIAPIQKHPDLALRGVYEYGFRVPDIAPQDRGVARLEMGAKLGVQVYEMDPPIHHSPLFRPKTKPRFAYYAAADTEYPNSDNAYGELFMIHHSVLLADCSRMDEIVDALLATIEQYAH